MSPPRTTPSVEAKPLPATVSTKPPPVTSDEGPFKPSSVTPAPSPTPVGQEPSSGFVVQVFSGRDQDQAKKVVQTLQSDGYQAYLSPVKVGSQLRYRVRIGPFDDRADAEGVERIVRQKYRYETWVTSAEN
jgi:DedD protein